MKYGLCHRNSSLLLYKIRKLESWSKQIPKQKKCQINSRIIRISLAIFFQVYLSLKRIICPDHFYEDLGEEQKP